MDTPTGSPATFRISLLGYDPQQVHAALQAADEALRSGFASRRAAVAQSLQHARFQVVPRGYRRADVKRHLKSLLERLQAPSQ